MNPIIAIIAAAVLFGCSNVDQRMECRDLCQKYGSTTYRVQIGMAGMSNLCTCEYSMTEPPR